MKTLDFFIEYLNRRILTEVPEDFTRKVGDMPISKALFICERVRLLYKMKIDAEGNIHDITNPQSQDEIKENIINRLKLVVARLNKLEQDFVNISQRIAKINHDSLTNKTNNSEAIQRIKEMKWRVENFQNQLRELCPNIPSFSRKDFIMDITTNNLTFAQHYKYLAKHSLYGAIFLSKAEKTHLFRDNEIDEGVLHFLHSNLVERYGVFKTLSFEAYKEIIREIQRQYSHHAESGVLINRTNHSICFEEDIDYAVKSLAIEYVQKFLQASQENLEPIVLAGAMPNADVEEKAFKNTVLNNHIIGLFAKVVKYIKIPKKEDFEDSSRELKSVNNLVRFKIKEFITAIKVIHPNIDISSPEEVIEKLNTIFETNKNPSLNDFLISCGVDVDNKMERSSSSSSSSTRINKSTDTHSRS